MYDCKLWEFRKENVYFFEESLLPDFGKKKLLRKKKIVLKNILRMMDVDRKWIDFMGFKLLLKIKSTLRKCLKIYWFK